jgi:hypothetical protein
MLRKDLRASRFAMAARLARVLAPAATADDVVDIIAAMPRGTTAPERFD